MSDQKQKHKPDISSAHDDRGSRRGFLRGLGAGGLAATMSAVPVASASAKDGRGGAHQPYRHRPRRPVPSNRLHAFANPFDDMPIEDSARIVAAAGFGGIDMTVRKGDLIEPEQVEDALPRAVEVCEAAGLSTEIITTQIIDPRDPLTEKILRTAGRQGITYFRLGTFSYNNYASVREAQREFKPMLKDMMQMARQFGLRCALQNHAGNGLSSAVWDLVALIEDLDPHYIGFHYDSRHAMVEGTGCWRSGYDVASPYIHVLIPKDFRWTVNAAGRASPSNQPVGGGIVDFDDFFKRARAKNIRAPLDVHFPYGIFNNGSWREGSTNRPSAAGEQALIAAMRADLEALRPHLTTYGYGWTV